MIPIAKNPLLLAALAIFFVGCSQETLSDRDSKLQQARLQAEAKRAELTPIAGEYGGVSTQTSGIQHEVLLHLEIRDVPTQIEGLTEPIMMPALSGFLKFYIGAGPDEFLNFAIATAGYNSGLRRVDFTGTHTQYGNMVVALDQLENSLAGNWTAPTMSTSGTVSVLRDRP